MANSNQMFGTSQITAKLARLLTDAGLFQFSWTADAEL